MGILARETTLFLVPGWLAAKQWRNLLLALVFASVAWYVPRMLFSSDSSAFSYAVGQFSSIDPADKLGEFLRPVFVHWGVAEIVAVMGMVLVPVSRFWLMLLVFALLALGALTSSLIASDIGRMMELLFPAMITSCAFLFATLWQRSTYLTRKHQRQQ